MKIHERCSAKLPLVTGMLYWNISGAIPTGLTFHYKDYKSGGKYKEMTLRNTNRVRLANVCIEKGKKEVEGYLPEEGIGVQPMPRM